LPDWNLSPYALRPGPRRPILAATSGSESAGAQGPPRLPRLEVVAHGVLHFSVEETVKQGHGESLKNSDGGYVEWLVLIPDEHVASVGIVGRPVLV
jgi:hypothetical protein